MLHRLVSGVGGRDSRMPLWDGKIGLLKSVTRWWSPTMVSMSPITAEVAH